MPRVLHYSELLNLTFAPLPSKLGTFIARYQEWFMGALVLIIILLSTWGIYNVSDVILACVAYLVYSLLLYTSTKLIRRMPILSNEKSYHLIRSLLSTFLIIIGLMLFPKARDPLWLVFMFPIWRVLEKDLQASLRILLPILFIATFTIYYQLSVRTLNALVFSPLILQETILRAIWLVVIVAILYLYTAFINRTKKAEAIRSNLTLTVGKQLFQADTLEDWCYIVLCQALKIVGGTYATFQVCNRLSGELRLVAAVKRKDHGFSRLDPFNITLAHNILFRDAESTGITGAVVRQENAISVLNVKHDPRYVRAFEDTYAEIAVPISDLIHDWSGGVINVEYTKLESPKSEQEIENLKVTLNEMAELLASQYSYVILSDFREKIREASLVISSLNNEEKIAVATIDALFRQYNCPTAIWLIEEGQKARLRLSYDRLLPTDYAHLYVVRTFGTDGDVC
jgi:hypothetical protein